MNWLIVVIILASIADVILGIYALLGRSRRPIALMFSAVSFIIAYWTATNALTTLDPPDFWVRNTYAAGVLVAPVVLIWVMLLEKRKVSKGIIALILTPTLFLFFLTYIDGFIVKNINSIRIGGFEGTFGPLFPIYSIFSLLIIGIIFYLLIDGLRKASGIYRIQLKFVVLGIVGFGVIVSFVSFISPLFGYDVLVPLDSPSSFIFILSISYAIFRYRLLNIRLIVAKTVLYFLLISTVASFFSISVIYISQQFKIESTLLQFVIIAIASVIVVLFIDPLKNLLAKVTDDIFYKDKIDYQKVLRDLSIIIAKEIDLEILLSALRRAMMEDLKLKAVDILVEKKQQYVSLTIAGKKLNVDDPLLEYLHGHKDIVITDELYRMTYDLPEGQEQRKLQAVLDELERNGIEFCAPIFLEGDLRALVILGAKQSGDIFTSEDVRFFNTLAPQVAVAIEKSQLYESISEFNIQLQEKINRATKKLKEYNVQLQEANAYLKQLDKAKSEFLSIASHQLRTPISALKGYLSMLMEGDFGKLDPKQGKIISDLFESASRLARLINIFLNVSRIESGRFKLDRSAVDISTLVESVVKELQGQANAKALKLTFDKNKHPISLYVDSDKVREVILNLVDNAIKYTKEGSIAMRTFIDEGNYHFVVKDTGLGIRKEDAPVLFRKFVRGTGMSQVNTQGSGLGLYIAQRVISEHGGKIWAESEGYGKGSEFHFTIPLKENQKDNFPVSAEGVTQPVKESVRGEIATPQ